MTQSRETRNQLWRELLTRSAMSPRRSAVPWGFVIALVIPLTVLALYLFTQL